MRSLLEMSRVMSLWTLSNVGLVAIIVSAPKLASVGGIHQICLNRDMVAVLHDAAHQNCAHPERVANFLRIVLLPLVAEHGAARHHLKVGQLRKTADQAFGQAVAEILIVGVSGGIDEGEHRN